MLVLLLRKSHWVVGRSFARWVALAQVDWKRRILRSCHEEDGRNSRNRRRRSLPTTRSPIRPLRGRQRRTTDRRLGVVGEVEFSTKIRLPIAAVRTSHLLTPTTTQRTSYTSATAEIYEGLACHRPTFKFFISSTRFRLYIVGAFCLCDNSTDIWRTQA